MVFETHIGGRLRDVKYIFARNCSQREDGEDSEEGDSRES